MGLLLQLEAQKDFAVHLLLVEGGKRASSVSVRDILVESGPYRHGFCYCEISNIKGKWPIYLRGEMFNILLSSWRLYCGSINI